MWSLFRDWLTYQIFLKFSITQMLSQSPISIIAGFVSNCKRIYENWTCRLQAMRPSSITYLKIIFTSASTQRKVIKRNLPLFKTGKNGVDDFRFDALYR